MSNVVIVTGGRTYANRVVLKRVLSSLNFDTLVEGGALGADRLAREYAEQACKTVETFYADWDTDGRAAGPIRNRRMLDAFPGALVVAFPGGNGTLNCINEAIKRGHVVLKVQ